MQGLCMAFIKFPIELFELKDPIAMVIMLRVIMRMDADGNGVCFESRNSMCEHIGIDRKTWTNKVESLESKGLIIVERKPNVPNHISLSEEFKNGKWGKNGSLTRSNIDLDRGWNFPQFGDQMEDGKPKKKKKRVVRKRPTNKISDPPLSELDAIHRKFIKKIEKSKASEDEST